MQALPSDSPITHEALAAMIEHLQPDHKFYAGKRFFQALLKERGVEGVVSFLDKAYNAISTRHELEFDRDFDPGEQKLYRRARLKLHTRRDVLQTLGWGIPGTTLLAGGVTGFAANAYDRAYGPPAVPNASAERPLAEGDVTSISAGAPVPEHNGSQNPFRAAHDAIRTNSANIELTLFGAACIDLAHRTWVGTKLKQVAEAVTELSIKMQSQKGERQ